jgi:hypothetical protein
MIDLDAIAAWSEKIQGHANDGLMSAGLLAALRRDLPQIEPPTILGLIAALATEDRQLRDLLDRVRDLAAADRDYIDIVLDLRTLVGPAKRA